MLKGIGEMIHIGESKMEYKKRVGMERVERLHGIFSKDVKDVVKDVVDGRSWKWLIGGYLAKSLREGCCRCLASGLEVGTL